MGVKRLIKKRISCMLFMLIFVIVLFPFRSLGAPEHDGKLTVVYFYENVCGSCDPEGEFIELFNSLVEEEKEGLEIELLMYNVFHASGSQLMEEYFEDFNVPKNKQASTMVFIGDSFLTGQSEIEENLKDIFVKAKDSVVQDPQEISTIQYFHVTACSSCQEVEKFLETIENIEIKEFNISQSEDLSLIKELFKAYDVPEDAQSVPIIFIGDTYLSGEKDIKDSLLKLIEGGEGLKDLSSMEVQNDSNSEDGLSGYTAFSVLVTGLINGLNPCSISMLLFFFSLLMVRNVSALKMGLSFICGKFITYFILGTLLFNVLFKLNIPWFQTSIKIVMILVLILMAILNTRDLYAARREDYARVRMQLPAFLRKMNHQWIKKFSNIKDDRVLMPVSFGLGVLISFGEFLCTGQIYLATIISVLHNSKTLDFNAIIYFIIYGLAFVVPLIILTFFIHKGREIFDLTEWVRERMPIIKLINAIVFVLFAIIILIWF